MPTHSWLPIATAPMNKAVLVYDGQTIAVGRQYKNGWMIDESFGFNEDGMIYDVTHWMELPSPPNSIVDQKID